MECTVIVPWVCQEEVDTFLEKWKINTSVPDWLILQQDVDGEGCGATKNKGIIKAMKMGAEAVVILDGDCYLPDNIRDMQEFVEYHCMALRPQNVKLFESVTEPPSRGTPYSCHSAVLPVAASMGFWLEMGDYCAVRQLVFGGIDMVFEQKAVYQRYFPLCGMNLAFKPQEWWPWCQFIDVPRFDDIWMGWLWQREAYRRGYCFNLNGPLVCHSRQSDVWKNLQSESVYLKKNETLWRDIALNQLDDYESLRLLLPAV